ncbi:MAG: cysteine desulfurase family protein, partial [Candidatus Gallimonas sp.]
AATAKMRPAALRTYAETAEKYFGNPSSLHSDGQRAAEELSRCRAKTAELLGCSPREIIFTSGGSEADNQAIVAAAIAGEKKGKKHIVSTAFEHHAVLHVLDRLKERGFEITLLPVGERGIVRAEQVRNAVRDDTCLVTVMFANNEIGTIQPVAEIGAVCREKKIPFHTDAVQAVGHVPVDVNALNADMLSLSAHKFGGPRGVGALVSKLPVRPLIEGGAQERGRRAGTENLPAIAAMTTALELSVAEMTEADAKIRAMRDKLIAGLKAVPHCALNGDEKSRLSGNVNFCFEGIEGESLLLLLDEAGIRASSGSACTSGSLDPSHVLLAIGRPHEVAHGSLRLTLSADNTQEEIDYMLKEIPRVVQYLRDMSPVWRDLQSGKRNYVL